MSEAIALQQVHTGFSAVRARIMPSLFHPYALPFAIANQPTQKEGSDTCNIVNKQAKMLLKDMKTKYLSNDK